MAIESLYDTITLAAKVISISLILYLFLIVTEVNFKFIKPWSLYAGDTSKALFSRLSNSLVFKADYKETEFPKTSNELLFAEREYKTRFESISFFRKFSRKDFPIEKALQDYHREPIVYAIALAQLNSEVFKTTGRRNREVVKGLLNHLDIIRRHRDMVGLEDYDSGIVGLNSFPILQYWMMKLVELPRDFFRKNRERILKAIPIEDEEQLDVRTLNAWESQFKRFVANINFFCQHTGSEVDELAPPHKTIQNLRKFASDRRQELAPLLEVNAKLNKELTSYKRINAALQTRYTIEKLVFELPDTAQYDVTGSGPKWERLWHQIWQDARKNVDNPFHTLWTQSTGQYARDNIRDKGRALFADMSGEIHGYDQGQTDKLDYEHFDASARKIAKILHDEPEINPRTGDVAWNKEIRKYPVAWPDEDNMALSKLQRLKSRVENLEQQLQTAKEEEVKEMNKQKEDERKRKERAANDAAQNDADSDPGISTLFLTEEE